MSAAEMREAAAKVADRLADDETRKALGANAMIVASQIATAIRALPLPPNESAMGDAIADAMLRGMGVAQIKPSGVRYVPLEDFRALPLPDEEGMVESGIYIASKAKHGPRWQKLRAQGLPIISTWIDESGEGETLDWPDLWSRCVAEAAAAGALVLIREPGEELKGALVEVGAALANGRPVFAVGINDFSVLHHPLATRCASLDDALRAAIRAINGGEP